MFVKVMLRFYYPALGDDLYTPPNFKHAVKTITGCTILFIVPEEVEIL
jgi:hypothetical protein